MREKVRKAILAACMFKPGDTVVIGVSGGCDSVALLHLLHTLEEYRLRLVVAHLNHMLRGEEADGDEAFVAAIARDWGLLFVAQKVNVAEYACRERLSVEEAGRICRYRFFDEVAAKHEASSVALAHHADDQAETVLMRLLRGSAGTGLRGMVSRTSDGRYVRPLLGVSRGDIEEYICENDLVYRIDSSNSDTTILRNRIRHDLLPLLQSFNPAVKERLVATAAALAADEEVLDECTDALYVRLVTISDGIPTFSANDLASEPFGLRMRLYRRILSNIKGDLRRISSRHLNDLDLLVRNPKPHVRLYLPDGIRVNKSYDSVTFSPIDEVSDEIAEVIIEGPGSYHFGDHLVTIAVDRPLELNQSRHYALFDRMGAPFPWMLRTFKNGDRFTPWGMSGHKKVKDLFIDEKVPMDMRRRIPLLFCRDTILWVCGIRRSAAAPVTDTTESLVAVDIGLVKTLNSL